MIEWPRVCQMISIIVWTVWTVWTVWKVWTVWTVTKLPDIRRIFAGYSQDIRRIFAGYSQNIRRIIAVSWNWFSVAKNSSSQAIMFDSAINIILDFSSHSSKRTNCMDWLMCVIVLSAQPTFGFNSAQAIWEGRSSGKFSQKTHRLPIGAKFSSVVLCWLRFQE
jgi:hypothetical protein